MKVILYSLPSEIYSNGTLDEALPPLAVYLLGACIRQRGYDVELYDSISFKLTPSDTITNVLTCQFSQHICDGDIVCFSCNSFNWGITKYACEIIKRMFDVRIIVGGLHPSFFYEHIMNTSKVDFVLRGEGEITLPQLVETICNGGDYRKISGLSYRKDDEVYHNYGLAQLDLSDFSEIPLPLFELIPKGYYQAIPIETSRGCLYNCIFCSIPNKNNRREFTLEEIKRRLDHADLFSSNFSNTKLINFNDDCFTFDVERFNAVFNMLASRNDGKTYFIEARINDLLKPGINFCNSSLHGMQIGIECGYDEGIRLVRKGTTVENLFRCADMLYKKSLTPITFFSFIIGFPWESEREINLTLDTIERLCATYDATVSLNWLILLPSELWTNRYKYHISLSEELYDKIAWILDKDYFDLSHPKISEKVFYRIEKRIVRMQLKGYKIRHPLPNTNIKSYVPELFT